MLNDDGLHSHTDGHVVFQERSLSLLQCLNGVLALGGGKESLLVVDLDGGADLLGPDPHSLHAFGGHLLHPGETIITDDTFLVGGGALQVIIGLFIVGRVEVVESMDTVGVFDGRSHNAEA